MAKLQNFFENASTEKAPRARARRPRKWR